MSNQSPTDSKTSATGGHHWQDGPDKIGVGCFIKVRPTRADEQGKHAHVESPTASA